MNYFGSILRIDVNQTEGYQIPEDNPFVGSSDGLPEIYAWGFRNPWKMSFDTKTGKLWVADVGEKGKESIYVVENGRNYGWPIIEGSECFGGGTCDASDIEIPVFEYAYGMDETGRSITGGYVYRGQNNPSFRG